MFLYFCSWLETHVLISKVHKSRWEEHKQIPRYQVCLRQINPHSAPNECSTNGTVAQGWGALCTTAEMSTRKEEYLRFIIHTNLALKSVVWCSHLCFWLHFCQHTTNHQVTNWVKGQLVFHRWTSTSCVNNLFTWKKVVHRSARSSQANKLVNKYFLGQNASMSISS